MTLSDTKVVLCDSCGAPDKTLVYEDRRAGRVYAACQQCGLIYCQPAGAPIFRPTSRVDEQTFMLDEANDLERYSFLTDHDVLHNIVRGRMLLVNARLGGFLRLMQATGWEATGLEPDADFADKRAERYQVNIAQQHYEDIVYTDGTFDLIVGFNVLNTVISAKHFLEKVVRELKPGGYAYFEVPSLDWVLRRGRNVVLASNFIYSRGSLEALLLHHGLCPTLLVESADHLRVVALRRDNLEVEARAKLDSLRGEVNRFRSLNQRPLTQWLMAVPGGLRREYTRDAHNFVPNLMRRMGISERYIERLPYVPISHTSASKRQLIHFGIHDKGNAGDTLLFGATRQVFDNGNNPYNWSLERLHAKVLPSTIARINSTARGVIIGGGGLLIRDTGANANSGWQWNCPIDQLRHIKVPLVVFGIGYNRFRDQSDFDPLFWDHIQETIRRSVFFSLRNTGSIKQLAPYLEDESLRDKLMYQPCPTTLIRYLYPQAYVRRDGSRRRLALNIAFDRHWLRFQGQENSILTQIARAAKRATAMGWEVVAALHCKSDRNFLPWLIREQVAFEEVALFDAEVPQILEFYSRIDLAVGMRGHSQMIPFGAGAAIISLVSHNKLQYFLDDLGHSDWGLEIFTPDLEGRLVEMIGTIGQNLQEVQNEIGRLQEHLWAITQQNVQTILTAL